MFGLKSEIAEAEGIGGPTGMMVPEKGFGLTLKLAGCGIGGSRSSSLGSLTGILIGTDAVNRVPLEAVWLAVTT
jgi:hypothetical protein